MPVTSELELLRRITMGSRPDWTTEWATIPEKNKTNRKTKQQQRLAIWAMSVLTLPMLGMVYSSPFVAGCWRTCQSCRGRVSIIVSRTSSSPLVFSTVCPLLIILVSSLYSFSVLRYVDHWFFLNFLKVLILIILAPAHPSRDSFGCISQILMCFYYHSVQTALFSWLWFLHKSPGCTALCCLISRCVGGVWCHFCDWFLIPFHWNQGKCCAWFLCFQVSS